MRKIIFFLISFFYILPAYGMGEYYLTIETKNEKLSCPTVVIRAIRESIDTSKIDTINLDHSGVINIIAFSSDSLEIQPGASCILLNKVK